MKAGGLSPPKPRQMKTLYGTLITSKRTGDNLELLANFLDEAQAKTYNYLLSEILFVQQKQRESIKNAVEFFEVELVITTEEMSTLPYYLTVVGALQELHWDSINIEAFIEGLIEEELPKLLSESETQ